MVHQTEISTELMKFCLPQHGSCFGNRVERSVRGNNPVVDLLPTVELEYDLKIG